MTLDELFRAGAHRSVESMIAWNRGVTPDFEAVRDALLSRFGADAVIPMPTIGILVGRVEDAIQAAGLIAHGQTPLDTELGVNPALPTGHSYTVVASVIDPLMPGEPLEIPWTIYSDERLTDNEIREQALRELGVFRGVRDTLPGGGSQDLNIRDRRFTSLVRQDPTLLQEVGIEILSAYRRG